MTKLKYSKHGKFNGAIDTMIMLVTGVGVAVMVLILVGTLGGKSYDIIEPDIDLIGKYSASGDVFLALNSTAASLDHTNLYSGTVAVLNGSDSVASSAYTVDYTAGTITLKNVLYNNTNLTASYDWANETVRGSVKRGILSSFDALEQTGSYLHIIVLAIVVSLVLFLVLGLANNRGGGSNTAL